MKYLADNPEILLTMSRVDYIEALPNRRALRLSEEYCIEVSEFSLGGLAFFKDLASSR